MEHEFGFNILAGLSQKLSKNTRITIKPEAGLVTLRGKTLLRIILSFLMVTFIIIGVDMITSDKFFRLEVGLKAFIAFPIGVGYMVYLLYKLNRTFNIDFREKTLAYKILGFTVKEYQFREFKKMIHESPFSGNWFMGRIFKLEFENPEGEKIISEIGRFNDQDEIETINILFNLIAKMG
jgi:hypothetical protein